MDQRSKKKRSQTLSLRPPSKCVIVRQVSYELYSVTAKLAAIVDRTTMMVVMVNGSMVVVNTGWSIVTNRSRVDVADRSHTMHHNRSRFNYFNNFNRSWLNHMDNRGWSNLVHHNRSRSCNRNMSANGWNWDRRRKAGEDLRICNRADG